MQLWLQGDSTIETPAARAPGLKCPFLLNEAGGQGWDAPSRHILSWLPSGALSRLSSLSLNSLFHQHLHYIRILAPSTYQISVAPACLRHCQHACFSRLLQPGAGRLLSLSGNYDFLPSSLSKGFVLFPERSS